MVKKTAKKKAPRVEKFWTIFDVKGWSVCIVFTDDVIAYSEKIGAIVSTNTIAFNYINYDKGEHYLVFPLNPTFGTISHEVVHAVMAFFRTIGQDVYSAEEMFCIYVDYLVNQIMLLGIDGQGVAIFSLHKKNIKKKRVNRTKDVK